MNNTQSIVTVLGVLIVVLLLGLGQTSNHNQQASAQSALASVGRQLHLFDGNNQDLGIVLTAGGTGVGFNTYIPSQDVKLSFSQSNNPGSVVLEPNRESIYFINSDCTGTPYSHNAYDPQRVTRDGLGRFYKYTIDPQTTLFIRSQLDTNPPTCNLINSNLSQLYHLAPITAPVTLPLAWPLRVGYPTVSSGSIE